MESKTNYYSVIPTFLLSSNEFTDGEKILCGLIAGFSNIDGYCYANNEKLAEYLNKSENSIKATLRRLYSKGLIENIGTTKRRKLKLSYIKSSEDLECQIDTLEKNDKSLECQIDTLECQIDTPYHIDKNKNKYNVQGHVQKNLDDSLSFENWYKIYPRKEKRDRAEKAFNKLTKYHKSILLQATQLHIEHKEDLNEIFEHPATFLNSKVFLDYEKETKENIEQQKTNEGAKNVLSILINKINATLKLNANFEKLDYKKLKTNEGAKFFNEFEISVLNAAKFNFEIIKEFDEDEIKEYLQNYIGEMI